jgi:hypothetical protein
MLLTGRITPKDHDHVDEPAIAKSEPNGYDVICPLILITCHRRLHKSVALGFFAPC